MVAGALALLVTLSWMFLLQGAGMGDAMAMSGMRPPLGALVLMWSLMMVAMMLPSAAPAILLYNKVREHRAAETDLAETWIFVAGYALLWLLFSVIAASAQQLLAGGDMALQDERLASAILIAAGAYQLSPLKSACLRQCQSPTQFLTRHWRSGRWGAVRLGLLHGAYCVGCCWMLMALLFVGGVMNYAWIAALTLLVGIEKLVPHGEWIGRAAGVALIGWGLIRLMSAG